MILTILKRLKMVTPRHVGFANIGRSVSLLVSFGKGMLVLIDLLSVQNLPSSVRKFDKDGRITSRARIAFHL